jgi:hypothetical protein
LTGKHCCAWNTSSSLKKPKSHSIHAINEQSHEIKVYLVQLDHSDFTCGSAISQAGVAPKKTFSTILIKKFPQTGIELLVYSRRSSTPQQKFLFPRAGIEPATSPQVLASNICIAYNDIYLSVNGFYITAERDIQLHHRGFVT